MKAAEEAMDAEAAEQTMIAKQATSAERAAAGSGAWLNDQGTGI